MKRLFLAILFAAISFAALEAQDLGSLASRAECPLGQANCAAPVLGTITSNTLLKAINSTTIGNSTGTDDGSNPTRWPNGLDTATAGNFEEYTVDTGGVAVGLALCATSNVDGNGRPKVLACPHTATQPGAGFVGMAQATVAAAGTVKVCWTVNCSAVFDNTSTALNEAILSTTTDGELHDTGSQTATPGQPNFAILNANAGGGTASLVSLTGMLAQNPKGGGGGGKGTAIEINGAASQATVNFNSTTPAADANFQALTAKISSSGNITSTIFQTPLATTGQAGIVQLAGDLGGTSALPSVLKVDGVSYPASPSTNTVPVITGSNTATYEAVPNAALANSSITINTTSPITGGTSVSLGSSITVACPTCVTSSGASWNGITDPTGNQLLHMGTDLTQWQGNGNAWPLFYFDPANGFGITTATGVGPATAFSTTAPWGLEIRGGNPGTVSHTPTSGDAIETIRATAGQGQAQLIFAGNDNTTNSFTGNNARWLIDAAGALHPFFHLITNNGSSNGYDWQWRFDGLLCVNPAFGCQFSGSVMYVWGDSGNTRPAATFDANGNSIAETILGNLQLTTNGTTTAATITKYNNISTAGQGVPPIYGSTLQRTETGADTNVLTFTPPAATGTYRLRFLLSVSAASAAVLGWTATWKDANGNSQAPTNLSLTQSGVAVPALTFTLAASGDLYGEADIDTDNSATAIVIKLTFTGTSFTGKASATVERLQ